MHTEHNLANVLSKVMITQMYHYHDIVYPTIYNNNYYYSLIINVLAQHINADVFYTYNDINHMTRSMRRWLPKQARSSQVLFHTQKKRTTIGKCLRSCFPTVAISFPTTGCPSGAIPTTPQLVPSTTMSSEEIIQDQK